MRKKLFCLFIAFAALFTGLNAQGFLKRDGKKIVNGNGEEYILRGVGLGGWMLQEGYMLQMNAFANPQYQIRAKFEEVMGKENTDTFYTAWLHNYIQKADVDSIKAWGYNSIRLPMHYNLFTLPIEDEPVAGQQTWLTKGFELTDSFLAWCKTNEIYLILDMHAAPGGQGRDAAISDYNPDKLSLWESDDNKTKLVALWRKLAERYSNEEWIGGYDLINEINWDFENSGNINGCNCNKNEPLLAIYADIIDAIREVDQNHMIILEGNCWGNNYNGMNGMKDLDDNLVISFHKYWNSNEKSAIQGLFNLSNTLNLPLWCGESGENSNHWFTSAIRMFEENGVGWAWWAYKKFGSISGNNLVKVTPEFEKLKKYWGSGGTKPSVEFSKAAMMQMAENLKIENVQINYSVMDAKIRQVQSAEPKPFKNVTIPGTVFATEYDYGRLNVAYFDKDTGTYHVGGGEYTAWNKGWAFRNDGVDIEACSDVQPNNGYNVGWTETGEWIQYSVYVDSTMAYKLNIRYASGNASSTVNFSSNGIDVTGPISLSGSGEWQIWKSASVDDVVLEKGMNRLRIHFGAGGINLNYFSLEYSKPLDEVPFKAVSAEGSVNGKNITLSVNFDINNASQPDINDFSVEVAGTAATIVSISKTGNKTIELSIAEAVIFGQTIKLSYNGVSLTDVYGKNLEAIDKLPVTNNRPKPFNVPSKIQAENYYYQEGLTLEDCGDTGGGKNIAYTNAGDFLDYYIYVKEAASFKFDFRVAAQNAGGIIELQIFPNDEKSVLGTISVPATGGWQVYKTVSEVFDLPAGQYLLKVFIKKPEYNINWFELKIATSVSHIEQSNAILLFPNPATNIVTINAPGSGASAAHLMLYGVDGKLAMNKKLYADNGNSYVFNVAGVEDGLYLLKFQAGAVFQSASLIIKR